MRKLQVKNFKIHGIGINDADYPVGWYEIVDGKKVRKTCPFYTKWLGMMNRTNSSAVQNRQPTYKGVTVCISWLLFTNFKSWMEKQNWEGNHLDKDLLLPDARHYSADTCVFISKDLNAFITEPSRKVRGVSTGVYFNKRLQKYLASCRNPFTKENEYLGCFKTNEEAHLAWKKRKFELAQIYANMITDERVKQALLNRYKV